MDDELLSECQSCVDGLSPAFFDGARRKTRQKNSFFFHDVIFGNTPKRTSKSRMVWHEVSDENPNFIPPVVCACDDYEYISTTDSWTEHEAKFPYIQLGATIDCDFMYQNGAGVYCNDEGDELGDAIENQFLKEQKLVDRAFDNFHELMSAELAINGKVKIEGKGIKPYWLTAERCADLNVELKGEDCWGKSKCGNPFDDVDMMNNRMFCKGYGNVTSHMIMTQETCNAMMASPDLQDCLKGFNARLRLPDVATSVAANLQPKAPFIGAKQAFTLRMDGGVDMQIWCVNAFFEFLNPVTNQKVKKNLLPYGKVLGFDLVSGDSSYGARWAYGGIKNMFAGRNRKRDRFSRAWIPENGKNMKYTNESAPLPLVYCPNASWCLQVCSDK